MDTLTPMDLCNFNFSFTIEYIAEISISTTKVTWIITFQDSYMFYFVWISSIKKEVYFYVQ